MGEGGGVDGVGVDGVGVDGAGAAGAAAGASAGESSLKSLKAATLASSGTIIQTSLPIGTFFVPAATRILAR